MAKGIETSSVRAVLTVDCREHNRDNGRPCKAGLEVLLPDDFPATPGDAFIVTERAADGWASMDYALAPQSAAVRESAGKAPRPDGPSAGLYQVPDWKHKSATVTLPLADWAAILGSWEADTPAQVGNHRELAQKVHDGIGAAEVELTPDSVPDPWKGRVLDLEKQLAELRGILRDATMALRDHAHADLDAGYKSEMEDLFRRLKDDQDGD